MLIMPKYGGTINSSWYMRKHNVSAMTSVVERQAGRQAGKQAGRHASVNGKDAQRLQKDSGLGCDGGEREEEEEGEVRRRRRKPLIPRLGWPQETVLHDSTMESRALGKT